MTYVAPVVSTVDIVVGSVEAQERITDINSRPDNSRAGILFEGRLSAGEKAEVIDLAVGGLLRSCSPSLRQSHESRARANVAAELREKGAVVLWVMQGPIPGHESIVP